MSKNFVSEVRRLKDSSLHTGTLKSITVDVESSSTPDTPAPEIVTAGAENEDLSDSDHSDILAADGSAADGSDTNDAAVENADSLESDSDAEITGSADAKSTADAESIAASTSEAEHAIDTAGDNTEDAPKEPSVDLDTSQIPDASVETENDVDVQAGDVEAGVAEEIKVASDRNTSSQNEQLAAESEVSQENLSNDSDDSGASKLPEFESSHTEIAPKVNSATNVNEQANLIGIDSGEAEPEAIAVEAFVVSRKEEKSEKASSDFNTKKNQWNVLPNASSEAQPSTAPNPTSDSSVAALKAELHEALHHEERLESRITELNNLLKQNEKNLSHLKLELGHAQRANTLLTDELAEAKQYILKLTEKSPDSTTPDSTAQPSSVPAPSVDRSLPHESLSHESIESRILPTQRQPKKTSVVGRTRPAVLAPRRSVKKIEGLPPMSTEQLASPSASSQARRSPQPSRTPARPPAKTPFRTRQPLNLPGRTSPSDAVVDSATKSQAPSSKKSSTAQPQSTPRKSGAMQRFSRPGLSRLAEEIPTSARDTESKDVKPKLSDSELGWFD